MIFILYFPQEKVKVKTNCKDKKQRYKNTLGNYLETSTTHTYLNTILYH